jgi:CBS domain-containing protein
MKTITELLDQKGREVFSIGPDATVYEALKTMADQEIGSLIVVENGRTVGIITERDYARSVILKGRSSQDTPVREIMTARPVCASPNQTPEECMAVMTEKRVRHLPVIAGDELLGLISIGDLVKSIISEQQFIIEQLEHYISG